MSLKFGRISDVDPVKGLVKVEFPDDEIVSSWIPVSMGGSADSEFFIMPAVNAHVWALMDEHCENGVVGGCIYDSKNKPSQGSANLFYVKFKDGTVIKYDQAGHKLTVTNSTVVYELSTAGHKIAKGSETLKAVISDLIDAINVATYTTPSGPSTPGPLNIATFNAIKVRLATLLQ